MFAFVTALAAAGCAETPSQSVRPSPTPGPPDIRESSSRFQCSGTDTVATCTVKVVVDPKGTPTRVILEFGPTESQLGQALVIADGVERAGEVSTTTGALPGVGGFCSRFTATNDFGSASTEVQCRPSFPVVRPAASSSAPSGSAAP